MAKKLRREKILNPIAYFNENNPDYFKSDYWRKPYDWHVTSIRVILNNMVYLGHTVFGKTRVKHIRSEQKIKNPKDEWIITHNTHEALVSQEMWDLVHSMIANKRRENKTGKIQMFSGLLRCSDCQSSLTFAGRKLCDGSISGSYSCSRYRTHGTQYCSSHYINYKALSSIILEDIQKNSRLAKRFESRYLKQLLDVDSIKQKKLQLSDQKEFNSMKRRIIELDKFIKKLFEDNTLGKITDERYISLSNGYEAEQKQLKERLEACKTKIRQRQETVENAQYFTDLIKKYTDINQLDAKILNELIDKIVICDKTTDSEEQKIQKIEIYYKFVGLLQG